MMDGRGTTGREVISRVKRFLQFAIGIADRRIPIEGEAVAGDSCFGEELREIITRKGGVG